VCLTPQLLLRSALKDPAVGISTKFLEQGIKGLLDQYLQKTLQIVLGKRPLKLSKGIVLEIEICKQSC
jgi:hypothetical protein